MYGDGSFCESTAVPLKTNRWNNPFACLAFCFAYKINSEDSFEWSRSTRAPFL